jgi:hypothetical protein
VPMVLEIVHVKCHEAGEQYVPINFGWFVAWRRVQNYSFVYTG